MSPSSPSYTYNQPTISTVNSQRNASFGSRAVETNSHQTLGRPVSFSNTYYAGSGTLPMSGPTSFTGWHDDGGWNLNNHNNHNNHNSNDPSKPVTMVARERGLHMTSTPPLTSHPSAQNTSSPFMASTPRPLVYNSYTSVHQKHPQTQLQTQQMQLKHQPKQLQSPQQKQQKAQEHQQAQLQAQLHVYPPQSQQQQQQQSQQQQHQHYSNYAYTNGFPGYPRISFGQRKLTTTLWEDEGTLCYQVDANGLCVARRQDNDMINGTKLLNVAGMSRGKRDGILKNEKGRVVVKVGAMHLKGVWITFARAKALAFQFKICDLLYPLFVDDPSTLLYPGLSGGHMAGASGAVTGYRPLSFTNSLQEGKSTINDGYLASECRGSAPMGVACYDTSTYPCSSNESHDEMDFKMKDRRYSSTDTLYGATKQSLPYPSSAALNPSLSPTPAQLMRYNTPQCTAHSKGMLHTSAFHSLGVGLPRDTEAQSMDPLPETSSFCATSPRPHQEKGEKDVVGGLTRPTW